MADGAARGGTRGGRDQFSWDNVKSDADREHYLGHSVKASVGRWQKGKDLFWYTRESGANDTDAPTSAKDAAREFAAIKAKEDAAIAAALGLEAPGSKGEKRGKSSSRRREDDRDGDKKHKRSRRRRRDDGSDSDSSSSSLSSSSSSSYERRRRRRKMKKEAKKTKKQSERRSRSRSRSRSRERERSRRER